MPTPTATAANATTVASPPASIVVILAGEKLEALVLAKRGDTAMPRYSSQARNKMLGKIHMGQKQLENSIGLDKERYRDMLDDRYGHRSAAHLSIDDLADCIEHMESQGAQFTPRPKEHLADDPQARKIRSLWLQLHDAGKVRNPSEAALAAFVKRQTSVDRIDWLAPCQASDVIECLKKWLDRDE